MCILGNHGIDWSKSREVFDYCNKHGLDTGLQLPLVSELSGNILLGERIIGAYHKGNIEIDLEDLSEAKTIQGRSISNFISR